MINDYPTATASVIALFAWLPIIVSLIYLLWHRSLPHKWLFVCFSAIVTWGGAAVPSYLLMPVVVFLNAAGPGIYQSSHGHSILLPLVNVAHFFLNAQFLLSIALVVAISFGVPKFLVTHVWSRVWPSQA
jgi:hypothetical protein